MHMPAIEVGILSSESICFRLNGKFRYAFEKEAVEGDGKAVAKRDSSLSLDLISIQQQLSNPILLEPLNEECSFELYHVVIGIQFHWERKETQCFKGKLKLFAENGLVTAVNILPLEDYLTSVISSEMSTTSSPEFLKAHAVISRSWLLAQMEKGKILRKTGKYESLVHNDEGYIRWYDREEHDRFDVCADDHCQRYQGITQVISTQVNDALKTTSGEVLTYNGVICDTRFYKCCGGITEKFENVWEPVIHPYLTNIACHSSSVDVYNMDLTNKENARAWILGNPPAYCNTHDKKALSQVLKDFDQETKDFYRWEVSLTQSEIKALLFRKIGIEVGNVLDLIPVERGASGRIIRLKIAGDKRTLIIGKELEIRKALSESHLYSSAFIVEKMFTPTGNTNIPDVFVLKGAGWGHGVGLCQIGAAIMGNNGFSYKEILSHYYPFSNLNKIY